MQPWEYAATILTANDPAHPDKWTEADIEVSGTATFNDSDTPPTDYPDDTVPPPNSPYAVGDFEGIIRHEVGHCVGLLHENVSPRQSGAGFHRASSSEISDISPRRIAGVASSRSRHGSSSFIGLSYDALAPSSQKDETFRTSARRGPQLQAYAMAPAVPPCAGR